MGILNGVSREACRSGGFTFFFETRESFLFGSAGATVFLEETLPMSFSGAKDLLGCNGNNISGVDKTRDKR